LKCRLIKATRPSRCRPQRHQPVNELVAFGEHVSPPIGDRAVFVRAFSTGFPISGWTGELAYSEIRALTDLVEHFVSSAPADAP
jgi:hypothetical protein